MLLLMGLTLHGQVYAPLSYGLFYANAALNGISSGFCDTSFNVWIIEIWEAKAAPYIQGLWLCFSIGMTIAPIIVEPFLGKETLHNSTRDDSSLLSNEGRPSFETKVGDGFGIASLMIYLAGIILFISYLRFPYTKIVKKSEEMKELKDGGDEQEGSPPTITQDRLSLSFVIICATLLITTYSAMDICHFEFLPTYLAKSSLKTDTSTSSHILLALSISVTLIRALGILITLRLKSHILMYIDMFFMGLGNIVIWTSNTVLMAMIGNVLFGIGLGTYFAALFSSISDLIPISNMLGGYFLFASGLTSSFLPILMGEYIEGFPSILIGSNFVAIVICVVSQLILGIYVIVKRRKGDKPRGAETLPLNDGNPELA